MVTPPATAASAKKGASRRASAHESLPWSCHTIAASTTGNITVEPLDSSAAANSAREPPTAHRLRLRSNRSHARSAARKKTADSVFLRSETHATDSTETG